MSFYGEDLAWIHDAGFGEPARAAAAEVRARVPPPGLVIDLGCGSGITAAALLEAGFDVLGVDVSADLLRIARERAPAARFVRASLDDVELEPAVAVLAISEVLNYGAERRDLAAFFRRVRPALAPGGLFLAGIAGPTSSRRTWREGDGWVVCADVTVEGDRLTRRIAAFREVAGSWRRSDEVHVQRLYPEEDVLAALRAAGFEARVAGTDFAAVAT